ncbi:MAG: TetR/AcrR family transcriptional regulator [Sphingopyxis sp.]
MPATGRIMMAGVATAIAPRSNKGAARREQILADLMVALASGALRNPSLREIGQALAMEPAHILYYFNSREYLLQSIIMRWDDESIDRAGKPAHVAADAPDYTLDDYAAAIAHNITRPGIVHLYLAFAAEEVDENHAAHGFFQDRFGRLRTALAAAIRHEQAGGAIAAHHDADVQARLLIALADGLQLQSLVDGRHNAAADLYAALGILRANGAAA